MVTIDCLMLCNWLSNVMQSHIVYIARYIVCHVCVYGFGIVANTDRLAS